MHDPLTAEIIKKLDELPILKKKALLELIKSDSTKSPKSQKESLEKWRKALLVTSVWTDEEIEEINKARELIIL